eukprot:4914299-Pleurochrysis_carterae.AAC.1
MCVLVILNSEATLGVALLLGTDVGTADETCRAAGCCCTGVFLRRSAVPAKAHMKDSDDKSVAGRRLHRAAGESARLCLRRVESVRRACAKVQPIASLIIGIRFVLAASYIYPADTNLRSESLQAGTRDELTEVQRHYKRLPCLFSSATSRALNLKCVKRADSFGAM